MVKETKIVEKTIKNIRKTENKKRQRSWRRVYNRVSVRQSRNGVHWFEQNGVFLGKVLLSSPPEEKRSLPFAAIPL